MKGAGGGWGWGDYGITVTVPGRWISSDLLQSRMRSLFQGDKLFDPIAMNAQQTGYRVIVVQVYSIGMDSYDLNKESAIK